MSSWRTPVCFWVLALFVATAIAQIDNEDDELISTEKRAAMRNALVRFGRAAPTGGMRNALVRFGKRSAPMEDFGFIPGFSTQDKRNGAPQPFVRFGRSGRVEHMHDILTTLQRLQAAYD